MFLVLDADALYVVGRHLELIKGYRRAVLTPNVVEFKRLSEQVVRIAFTQATLEDPGL
jgi:ATP-dependent NAD(P)H-hydrate dehydratase